jgi:hypothetical protein
MQNAKPTREKAVITSEEQSPAAPPQKSLEKEVQDLINHYTYNLQGALLGAQMRQTQAAYDYYENLQHATKPFAEHVGQEHIEELKASSEQQDAPRYLEAQKKYWESVRNAYLGSEKNVERAATNYYESLHKIWNELQKEIQEKNASLANSLKDAVSKKDVTAADVPILAAIYYGTSTSQAGFHKSQR